MKASGPTSDPAQPASTPYSEKELEYFRNLLHEKRKEAEEELDRIRSLIDEKIELGTDEKIMTLDMADIGTDVEDQDTDYTLLERLRKYIIAINDALERIENGTYGICRATGKKISQERLEAVPHTRYSIEAKKEGLAD